MSWIKRPLGEVASIDRSGIPPELISDGTTYVGLENMTGDGMFLDVREVDNGELASTKFAFNENHVLYGKLRPYLRKTTRPDFRGVCSTDILPISAGPQLNRNFLYHFLRLPETVRLATTRSSGANLPRISPRILEEFEIPVPSLPEQKRIAEVLDKADSLLQKRRLALQKLDSLLQAVFLDMFGDPVMNTKGWVRKKADDLTTLVSSGITPLGGSSIYVSKGIPFIRSQNVLMNAFDMSDVAFVTKDLHNQMRRTWVKNGDVLFNITGASIGRVHFYAGDDDSANVNQHVCIIRPDQKQVLTEFLSYFLSLPSFQASILGRNAGATRQAFNFQQIRNFDVIVPPRADQAKFVSIRKTIEAMKERMIESAVNINKAFGSIQQRAFKGELFRNLRDAA